MRSLLRSVRTRHGPRFDGRKAKFAFIVGGNATEALKPGSMALFWGSSGCAYLPCEFACQISIKRVRDRLPVAVRHSSFNRHSFAWDLGARELRPDRATRSRVQKTGQPSARRSPARLICAPSAWLRGRSERCQTGTRALAPELWSPNRIARPDRWRAFSSAVQLKMGSKASSGSPGKYICVTSRVANAGPNNEK